MSREVSCKPSVLMEDELEEGEIPNKVSAERYQKEKRKLPRRYKLSKFQSSSKTEKEKREKAEPNNLLRRSGDIAKAKHLHKPYICRLHQELANHQRTKAKHVKHVPHSRYVKHQNNISSKQAVKPILDHNVSSRRNSDNNFIVQYCSEFSNTVRSHDKGLKERSTRHEKIHSSSKLDWSKCISEKSSRKSWNSNGRFTKEKNSTSNSRNYICRQSTYFEGKNDIDSNTSYEELLEKYKSIQLELASLEHVDQTKTVNLSGSKAHSRPTSSSEEKHFPQFDRVNSQKDECYVTDNHGLDIFSSDTSLNNKITVHITEANRAYLNGDECFAPCFQSRNTRNKVCSVSDQVMCLPHDGSLTNKENVPSSFSAAYSVSDTTDNYEVLDMDESTDDGDALEKNTCLETVISQHEPEKQPPDLEAENLHAQLFDSLCVKNPLGNLMNPSTPNSADKNRIEDKSVACISNKDGLKNNVGVERMRKTVIQGSHIWNVNQVTTENVSLVNASFQKKTTNNNRARCLKLYSRKHLPLPLPKQAPLVVIPHASDSSEEKSDTEDIGNNEKAAIASLERLINSVKNESVSQPGSTALTPTQEANLCIVDCLPKAQQMEYNKLKEIIAQKESEKVKTANNESIYAYSLLAKKLELAESMNLTGNKILKMAKTHLDEKKAAFICSQVEVQRLQKQLDAAIKVKDRNKKLMFEADSQLHAIQSSRNKRIVLIKELEKEHMKLEKHLNEKRCSIISARK